MLRWLHFNNIPDIFLLFGKTKTVDRTEKELRRGSHKSIFFFSTLLFWMHDENTITASEVSIDDM